MNPERDQLRERYLQAQLREELGEPLDLSEHVLRAVYSTPQRRMPPVPRRSIWRPLAAAAVVLLTAGLTAYWLTQVLPQHTQRRSAQDLTASDDSPPTQGPRHRDEKQTPPVQPTAPDDLPDDSGEIPQDPTREPEQPILPSDPLPDTPTKPEEDTSKTPDDTVEKPSEPDDHGWTDPRHRGPDQPPVGETAPPERAILVAGWKGDEIRIGERRLKHGDDYQIRAGDRVRVRGHADFTLMDGSLLRVEGEVSFEGEAAEVELKLHDGAVYADTTAAVRVTGHELTAVISGVAVIEERLRALDIYCLKGQVSAGEHSLAAGVQSRLSADGFGREKLIQWADLQREFKFLRETPQRTALREELSETPGKLFGGEIADGILKGEAGTDTGLGFYLREPYSVAAGDVVRFRFKVHKPCELILQFGTINDGNWRHKLGGVKAGEWIEFELPLMQLYKTADVSQRAQPGLELKFFQLHPEGSGTVIEIDWVEIVHRP